jgi:DNA-binding NarL/FixJ family response regulator
VIGGEGILAYEPDLLFYSKLDNSIRKMGREVVLVTDHAKLQEELTRGLPKVLVLNLDALEGKLELLRDLLNREPCASVGYYSHTNTRLAEEVKRAGIRVVLPRGAFMSKIQKILEKAVKGW